LSIGTGLGRAIAMGIIRALLILFLIFAALSLISLLYGIIEIWRGKKKIGVAVIIAFFLSVLLSKLTSNFLFIILYFIGVFLMILFRLVSRLFGSLRR